MKSGCKICHGGECADDELFSPCKCAGTIKYIHKGCLLSWMAFTKTNRCNICHYQYRFKEVYREDVPERLPAWMIAKGVAKAGWRVIAVLIWSLLSLCKWIGIFYVNGGLFMLLTGICNGIDAMSIGQVGMFVGIGIPLTWLAQMNQALFLQIRSRVDTDARRRGVPSAVVAMREEDASVEPGAEGITRRRNVSAGESDHIANEINYIDAPVSDVSVRLNERQNELAVAPEVSMSLSTNRNATEMDGGISEAPGASREFASTYIECVSVVKKAVYEISGLTVPVLFLPAIYGVSRMVYVPAVHCSFADFVSDVWLGRVCSMMAVFGVVFWIVIECMERMQTVMKGRTMRSTTLFMKTYYILLINTICINMMLGLAIHYMFVYILNRGVSILEIGDDYGMAVQGMISFGLHVFVGHSFGMGIRNALLAFKKCFRAGVLHFVPDEDESRMDELYEASKMPIGKIHLRIAMLLVFILFLYGFGFKAIWCVCGEIARPVVIDGYLKMCVMYKMFSVAMYSSRILCEYVVYGVNRMVMLESKILRMDNFLYNVCIKRYEKERLAWCANRNRIFRRQHIHARGRRRVSDEEIEKHFGKKCSSDFSIFYVPRMFAGRCICIGASVIIFLYGICAGYCKGAKAVIEWMDVSAYVGDNVDIVFISILVILLRATWTIAFIVYERVNKKRRVIGLCMALCKHGVANVYMNLVYPVFGSMMVMMLLSDEYERDGAYLLRLLVFFFSSTSVVKGIFHSSPESYSFKALIRELCKINALVSIVLGAWYIYNATRMLFGLSNAEFVAMCVLVGYLLFVSKKIGERISGSKGFYMRLVEENYLIERRIMGVDE
ncbi:putative RING-variant domain-containing protein [Ordospora pajunii]|uniref:putative RING-variant domain-containing protein n=1 Tax=Ordospora pajunii TaxID=3039483 RepID=UPI002952759D|nr:putative RING-variant domain-containing protein [Ordospora pajunii]KAH9411251.1 putative RING-variant domain-containing protein [Ordospora pajunii]